MARAQLASDTRFRFVRRVITRPSQAGGEDHESVSESDFALRRFALQWSAHGLYYGIPIDIVQDLARGRVVVANVSRGVIIQAADLHSVCVIEVTAPPQVLAERLAARGRETTDDVSKRLARSVSLPSHVAVDTIVNDGTLAKATERFIGSLIRVAESVPPR